MIIRLLTANKLSEVRWLLRIPMARLPASEKTRNALKDMFASKTTADRSSPVRQAARLIVEKALKSDAADAIGHGYYEC